MIFVKWERACLLQLSSPCLHMGARSCCCGWVEVELPWARSKWEGRPEKAKTTVHLALSISWATSEWSCCLCLELRACLNVPARCRGWGPDVFSMKRDVQSMVFLLLLDWQESDSLLESSPPLEPFLNVSFGQLYYSKDSLNLRIFFDIRPM